MRSNFCENEQEIIRTLWPECVFIFFSIWIRNIFYLLTATEILILLSFSYEIFVRDDLLFLHEITNSTQ